MAKVDSPIFGDTATGRLGQAISFKNTENWPQVSGQFHRGPTRSSAALVQQAAYAAACALWNALPLETKELYNSTSPEGQTGFNLFISDTLGG